MSIEASLKRKSDHIDLCHTGEVGLKGDPSLFSEVKLIHQAMPELAMAELDLSTVFLEHTLAAPLLLTGMTGGPDRAKTINYDLARLCQELGIAFGVGSQRIIHTNDRTAESFQVRAVAPDVCLLGNIGINQARDLGPLVVRDLFHRIEANYMAIHLNPAMELIQPGAEADSDFTAGYDTIARLVDVLEARLIVKECGSGLSGSLIKKLKALGVPAVDVSGVGGTSWIRVEALRADGPQAALGYEFEDWGIPTAATTWVAGQVEQMTVISSGGISNGRTAAKALALGADLAGMARPVLKAYLDRGTEGAEECIRQVLRGLQTSMALTGCKTPEQLKGVPMYRGACLMSWCDALSEEER